MTPERTASITQAFIGDRYGHLLSWTPGIIDDCRGDHWHETGTGKTITQQVQVLGIKFHPIPMVGIADGISKAVMVMPRLCVSEPRCEQFLSAIRNYSKKWDEVPLD